MKKRSNSVKEIELQKMHLFSHKSKGINRTIIENSEIRSAYSNDSASLRQKKENIKYQRMIA